MFADRNVLSFNRKTTMMVMVSTIGAMMAVGFARTALAEKSPGSQLVRPGHELQLAVGDRVKITFFEILDVPASEGGDQAATGSSAPIRSFFQRMDLTGEYSVELDGSISIPRLGAFDVARRTVNEIQSKLADGFEKTMSRPCDVSIVIVERQPIYVMGAARQPGSYKYSSGLMVLQALALAGGLERQAESSSRLVDILREQERYTAIAARLKRLLAQKARLESDRDGTPEPVVPQRLRDLASTEELQALLKSELATMKQQRRAFEEENLQNGALVEAVRREIEAIDERRSKGLYLVELRELRVREMSALSNRGSVSSPALTMAKTDLAQVASDVEQNVLLKVQAQQRLQQAQRDKARAARERETRIESELALTAEDIIRAERELAAVQRITETLSTDVGLAKASGQGRIVYEIVRRQDGAEATKIQADEMTLLAPGDILKVMLEPTLAHAMETGSAPAGN